MSVELFISYHEADKKHLRELEKVLRPRERGGAKSSLWHRGLARAGDEVEALAARRFETARVIVLLLSSDFLADDRLYDEATLALQRQREGSARVVPVVVRPCNLEETALEGLAMLPKGAGAIATATNADEAWTGVASEVGAVIKAVAVKAPVMTAVGTAEEPRYSDEATSALGRRLQAALRRRDQLLDEGKDDAALVQKILDLKRRLREKGQLNVGDVLGARRYKLVERIGRGGFADVWRAEMGAERREVAVKVLHANLAGDRERVERFFRGARAMARLRHPGIVRILEQRGEDRGWYYFVMELVTGQDLHRAVLAGAVKQGRVAEIVLTVGEALAEAHRKGMVHRDVKPSNILLDEAGIPRLTDFDLVALGDSTGGTRTGAMGTFFFAAPEILHRPQEADARADVYGLGMTAMFCWYGRELPPDVVWAPEEVLDALPCEAHACNVLRKAITKKAAARYNSMAAFCAALRAATSKSRLFEALLSWVDIPAGEFLMGSPADDKMAFEDERPQRLVSMSAFSLAQTPVTIGQYAAVMGKHVGDADPNLPVTGVTWVDALEFCNALSRHAGRQPCYILDDDSVTWIPKADGFRLPTEAEWEYACRAGRTTRYSFGDDLGRLNEYAWLNSNSKNQAHPVGQKRPNPWGLHDMHGNVWEWVWDVYGAYEQRSTSQDFIVSNKVATTVTLPLVLERVVRGGSFGDLPRWLRSAYRSRDGSRERYCYLGFRCAAPPRRQR